MVPAAQCLVGARAGEAHARRAIFDAADHRQGHAAGVDGGRGHRHHELVVFAARGGVSTRCPAQGLRDQAHVFVQRQRIEVDDQRDTAALREPRQVGGQAVGDVHHRVHVRGEQRAVGQAWMRAAMAFDAFVGTGQIAQRRVEQRSQAGGRLAERARHGDHVAGASTVATRRIDAGAAEHADR